jgi:type II restriction enzyme
MRRRTKRNIQLYGWTRDVLVIVDSLNKAKFSLSEVYESEEELAKMHPANRHVREKIRQQLQVLRDVGILEFLGRGQYRIS